MKAVNTDIPEKEFIIHLPVGTIVADARDPRESKFFEVTGADAIPPDLGGCTPRPARGRGGSSGGGGPSSPAWFWGWAWVSDCGGLGGGSFGEGGRERSLLGACLLLTTSMTPGNGLPSDRLEAYADRVELNRKSCGPTSLWYCLRQFGLDADRQRLCDETGGGPDGTSLEALVRTGTAHGLNARAVVSTTKDIDSLPVPSIIVVERSHCVVFQGIDGDGDTVRVFDPTSGQIPPGLHGEVLGLGEQADRLAELLGGCGRGEGEHGDGHEERAGHGGVSGGWRANGNGNR